MWDAYGDGMKMDVSRPDVNCTRVTGRCLILSCLEDPGKEMAVSAPSHSGSASVVFIPA